MKNTLKKFHIKKVIIILLIFAVIISTRFFSHKTVDVESFVAEIFENIKNHDEETINTYITVERYVDSDGEKSLFAEKNIMEKTLFEKLDYEILSILEMNDNIYNVEVKVTNVDMYFLAEEYSKKVKEYIISNPQITDEELDKKEKELFVGEFMNPNLNLVTNEIVVRVEKEGSHWNIIPSNEIEDAVTGGLCKLIELAKNVKTESVEKPKEIDLFFEIVEQEDVQDGVSEDSSFE